MSPPTRVSLGSYFPTNDSIALPVSRMQIYSAVQQTCSSNGCTEHFSCSGAATSLLADNTALFTAKMYIMQPDFAHHPNQTSAIRRILRLGDYRRGVCVYELLKPQKVCSKLDVVL